MSREQASGEGVVGRNAERAWLDVVLSDLGHGAQRCLVISGEPGIGKTTLLRHLEASAARMQCRTLSGTGAEFERDVPFALLINAVDDYVRSLDERFLQRACGP